MNHKLPYAMNLQLFAGETKVVVDGQMFEIDPEELGDESVIYDEDEEIEVVDGVDGDEEEESEKTDTDESAGSEADEEEGASAEGAEGQQTDEKPGKKDNPTASAVIAERKKWQAKLQETERVSAIAQKLMKIAGVNSIEEMEAKLAQAEAVTLAKQKNITPEEAQARLREQKEKDDLKKEVRRLKFSDEVAKLKADPFYSDIDSFREEFETEAERTGQTLEEVYMAKRGRQRMKEYEAEVEERAKANREKKAKTKIDTTANGENVKQPKVSASPEVMTMAKAAVKQGTFKTVEEYIAYHKQYAKKK